MLTAAHDDSAGTETGFVNGTLGVGVTLEDLRCPICVETIKDPFVTTCGHTFCFTCITTHLRNKRSCPSCAVYITQDSIHPNFLLNKITQKAATINPDTSASLLDHVTRLLAVAGSSVKVHEVQQVIELLEATKGRLQEQENTNNLELLLLFLQHARVQKERQLLELQRQMSTLERDLSSARLRCERGTKVTASGTSSMLPYQPPPPQHQQQQQQQVPQLQQPQVGSDSGSGATVPMVVAAPTRSAPPRLAIPAQQGAPMLQPPPITAIPPEAYSYLSQDSDTKPNVLPTSSQGVPPAPESARSQHSYHSAPLLGVPSTSVAGQPLQPPFALQHQLSQPLPQGGRLPGSSGVGFRPYHSAVATASHPALATTPAGPSTSAPAAPPPATHLLSASTSNNSNQPHPAAGPPPAHPARRPPEGPRHPTPPPAHDPAPASSSAHSAANTVTGPDAVGAVTLPPLPPPATAANEALRAAKRRRIMLQFDELQQCYLRLRHTSIQQQQPAAGQQVPGQAPTADHAIGAIEDDAGLDLFTQMLCAATHYAKLAVVAELPRSTSRPASILSSIEFDMDEQLFATAGVTQKISVYDFATIMASPREQHSAVVEIPARSKLSCISWSPAVRHHLISSDYDGIVQLWDVATRTSLQEYEAHERRIWSVDFNPSDPQYFASGSDDGKVKVWSANEASPAINIDVKANVCSVQYNPQVSHSLAVGSANHSVMLYDLRKAREPLATYAGHRKAVSYVRFANSFELVSASTDSTLRLWDTRTSRCVRTFSGHGNEKNFVGLSVDGEFIACGSESNRVYVYYKAIPKPTMHHSFSPAAEGEAGPGHFVTSVCWKRGYNHLVAANSSGSIWIMSLVD